MPKRRRKRIHSDAITFDELVAHGVASGVPLNGGMPWSFAYKGHPVTHETDDLYLIATPIGTLRFHRGDMLITGLNGEVYPCPKATYDRAYGPA